MSTVSPTVTARRSVALYGANLRRLTALKAVYDPTNLFRQNANIAP